MKKFFAFLFAITPLLFLFFIGLFIYKLHLPDKIWNFGYDSVPDISSENRSLLSYFYNTIIQKMVASQAIGNMLEAKILFWGVTGVVLVLIARIFIHYGNFILYSVMSYIKEFTTRIFFIVFPQERDMRGFIMKSYIRLLYMSIQNIDFLSIWKAHLEFYNNINKKTFTNKERYLFSLPFSYRGYMEKLYSVIHRTTKYDDCISIGNPIICSEKYISLYINLGNNKAREIKEKIIEDKTEFLRILPGYNDEDSIFELTVKDTGENLIVEFYNKDKYWENQILDLDNFDIKKGELVLGFYPEFVNGAMVYQKYSIQSSDLIMCRFSGSSGSGKDSAFRVLCYSIIRNIQKYSNFELITLEGKGNDWGFIDSLQEKGMIRYTDIRMYRTVLSQLETEMKNRIQKIGIHETFREYNDTLPEKQKMKEIFLVLNELTSLILELEKPEWDKSEKEAILGLLGSLISQARSSGIHILAINQSFKKTGRVTKNFSDSLVNFKDAFILQTQDYEEAKIVGKGLGQFALDKIRGLTDYTVLHVANSKILKKYKPYYISKMDLKNYVLRNFQKDFSFKNEKIQAYYQKVLRTGEIGSRESQGEPWNLSPSEWTELKSYLVDQNMITQNPNNSLSFIQKKSL